MTRRLDLGKTLTLSDQVQVAPGAVVAGRVKNDKSAYSMLEDCHGRMSHVQRGDVVVGALGHRNALHGYQGVLPELVEVGKHLQLLNAGGVVGECQGHNPDVGPPFELEILGQVLCYPDFGSRQGKPASITDQALEDAKGDAPIIFVAGTCMNSGKTAAACAIVRRLAEQGRHVAGAKLTGVSLIRDILAMRDYGAEWAADFTDAGLPATSSETALPSAQRILGHLAAQNPDVIVAETGDGIMGEYGVQAILANEELRARTKGFVLCANDPVGVAGAIAELQSEYGISPTVVTGPATDNSVGTRFVTERFGISAINARSAPNGFADLVIEGLA